VPAEATQCVQASPQLVPGLIEELTSAYAFFLKQQRTASSAYVRWASAHSRSHEFAWLEPGSEILLMAGGQLVITPSSRIYSPIQKMMATMELNPYERELRYGYPYVVGQIDGKAIRAPLLSVGISITADRERLIVTLAEDVARFNSLPFRTESDSVAKEQSLARLIEQVPSLPLTSQSLQDFCGSVTRELQLRLQARLDGAIAAQPSQPRSGTPLTVTDSAACFVAPKSSYFLVSDLQSIGGTPYEQVSGTALAWLIGERPSEPTSDTFDDRKKAFYPFSSNPSQRRVAHLLDDPRTRIAVMQGPPGTGKSLTIANLVCHLVATGKKVLVSSQKDKALDVVDGLLQQLELSELPMTLLRKDSDSKHQLRQRLDSIQKEKSSEETRSELEKGIRGHEESVQIHESSLNLLKESLIKEHETELADKAVKVASGRFAKLRAKWKRRRALRRAEKHSRTRSDKAGDLSRSARDLIRAQALRLLARAAEHRTSSASKLERNQLREFAKLLGRNQTSYKNFPIFDRLKADPGRCNMLLGILPCWIMTPDDVARLFPCTPGLFDVVIVDEASQCDLPSMAPVLYRAKQAVIAGDSKQMQAQRFAFTAGQIASQAWAERGLDRFDPDRWLDPTKIDLLQLASIRMDEEVFLDEHYRCLPPIIEFSNKRWYGERLRIMRDLDDKRVGPPDARTITLHKVDGKVTPDSQENPIEANALIDHLLQMLNDPGYAEASFGVICLFQEQMRLVHDLVAEKIPEELRSAHDLVVVNPDGFQGDEREVILYSLSFDAEGMTQAALSARQSEREHIQGMLNVAFTRGRDELHVFHSADINQFALTSGGGAIRDWLEHCSSHSCKRPSGDQQLDVQIKKAQSQFEVDLLAALSAAGVKVTAQYPTCGYLVDCVAELDGSRVAIECDGEVWHLDEHGQLKGEDVARQEVLERAGWRVIRVPYRSWREDSQGQVNRILESLGNETCQTNMVMPSAGAVGETLQVDRFEQALVEALKAGIHAREDMFKFAREVLGYARLGTQVRANLSNALDHLVRRKVAREEDGEVFFADDSARSASYALTSRMPNWYGSGRRSRRF
jgi:very-short-patch-repair endonuclease